MKTAVVWRIEGKDGLGPWHTRAHVQETYRHSRGWPDVSSMRAWTEVFGWSEDEGLPPQHYRAGCEDLADIIAAFGPAWAAMAKAGLRVTAYKVPRRDVRYGMDDTRQVAFDGNVAERILTMPLDTVRPRRYKRES